MRSSFRRLALLSALAPWQPAAAQEGTPLRSADRARLAEAVRLGDAVRERVWPGWGATPVPILLVTDSLEYLVGHPRPTAEFRPLSRESIGGHPVLVRTRVFDPTLLATFPAVGGVPTAVVGTAERTGKRSTEWVLAVLHEQFHQWQYGRPDYYARVAALDLADGDSTGRWMLDYPFPYERPPVHAALGRLAVALRAALDGGDSRAVLAARRALGEALTAPEERYLEFQLWQEGVARYVEHAAARAAAREVPGRAFRALPDYEPYAATAARLERTLRRELDSLPHRGRVAFYSIGAAMARLIATSVPGWQREYAAAPPRLDRLLQAAAEP